MILAPADYYRATLDQKRFTRLVSGPFEEGITHGQRKRIAKCEREGLTVRLASIAQCYPIIAENRARKGRPYSMTLADWFEMAETYPHHVDCFAVDPGPVAAAMCVRLQPKLLYVQAWGDVPGQEQLSPVTLLAREIYRWCHGNGIEVMDIGTADDAGLIRFKESLGFRV